MCSFTRLIATATVALIGLFSPQVDAHRVPWTWGSIGALTNNPLLVAYDKYRQLDRDSPAYGLDLLDMVSVLRPELRPVKTFLDYRHSRDDVDRLEWYDTLYPGQGFGLLAKRREFQRAPWGRRRVVGRELDAQWAQMHGLDEWATLWGLEAERLEDAADASDAAASAAGRGNNP